MKLLQLGIASLPFIDACVSFNAEERTHFTDTIGVLLILAPHLSQFMTTFTAGQVNLEPAPPRNSTLSSSVPAPGAGPDRTTSITQLDRRRRDSDQCRLWAESCLCAATVGRQDSSTSTGDLLCPLYVDSCRPLRANTGRSPTARRTGQVDRGRVKTRPAHRHGGAPWLRPMSDMRSHPVRSHAVVRWT
jgi:hypothetical protein